MYTSYIGKKFLKLYNEREHKSLTAKQFFEDVFFELFFQDDGHLMHVGNSPFFQKPKPKDVEKHGGKSLAQLYNLQTNIDNDEPNMAIFVGYAARDLQGTTSGQVTSLDTKTDTEEMYASWLGQALGIGVSGGFVMLIDREEVLWSLFEGWKCYRKYYEQTPNVKDKQIETWNGHWLSHAFSKKYNSSEPESGFELETVEALGKIAIPTNQWSKVVFGLANKYPSQVVTAYAYNLSQTNTTLGFINLYLPQVCKLYQLRDKIFLDKKEMVLKDKEIEELQTFYNFKNACMQGVIGLKALEPAKLRTYMPKGSAQYAQGKDFKFKDDESHFNYNLFKLWITAMLNKTELLDLASEVAKAILEFENPQEGKNNRGKTTSSRLSQEIREAKNLKNFIEKLTELLEENSQNAETFKSVVEQVLKMPTDNFPLFITLIRFEYQYQKSEK